MSWPRKATPAPRPAGRPKPSPRMPAARAPRRRKRRGRQAKIWPPPPPTWHPRSRPWSAWQPITCAPGVTRPRPAIATTAKPPWNGKRIWLLP